MAQLFHQFTHGLLHSSHSSKEEIGLMIVVPRKLKFLILMIKLNSSSKLRYKANAVNNMVSVENNSFQISILMMMVKLVQLDSDSLTLQ